MAKNNFFSFLFYNYKVLIRNSIMSGISIIDEIVKELTIISYIDDDQKIHTASGSIIIDDNNFQSNAKRWYNGESREKNVSFIERTINKCCEIIRSIMNSEAINIFNRSFNISGNGSKNGHGNDCPRFSNEVIAEYKRKVDVIKLLSTQLTKASDGIQNLQKTYHQDKQIVSRLEIITKNIEREVNDANDYLKKLTELEQRYYKK